MSEEIDTLTITDFRSVKGSITVPLDAPVVLIHGQNGTGKTSILSGLELALTGDIAAMRRDDGDYLKHLVHYGAARAAVRVTGPNTGSGRPAYDVTSYVENGQLVSQPTLSESDARFFSERCYLVQSTLGRLLEIYQHADPQKDSPLTRFVKDLLSLDRLDALVEGLHDATDIRRTKNLVPEFRAADERCKSLRTNRDGAEANVARHTAATEAERQKFRQLAKSLPAEISGASPPIDDMAEMQVLLKTASEEAPLLALAQHRRELESVRKAWADVASGLAAADRAAAEEEETASNALVAAWREGPGANLTNVLEQLRSIFPDLPSWESTDPQFAHQTAVVRIAGEIERLQTLLSRDHDAAMLEAKINEDINRAAARLQLVGEQLAGLGDDASELSRLLAAFVPHVHGEACPICDRPFTEVSSSSLLEHLQQKIARLTAQADRLAALSAENSDVTTRIAAMHREREKETSKRITQEDRVTCQTRLAKMSDAAAVLAEMATAVATGGDQLRRLSVARRRLAELRDRDRLATDLRANTAMLCSQLGQPALGEAESLDVALDRLQQHVMKEEVRLGSLHQARLEALASWNRLAVAEAARREAEVTAHEVRASLERAERLYSRAESCRLESKAIAQAARAARTTIVRTVFNESLNTLWRELFVRLAPTEPFVPAFRLPTTAEGVVASLETLHRSGDHGGTPATMLSAGNLNTAALTLFLALHLSVAPQFRWLVLDDPVQSMDELHIAQFAALLRTLSKSHGRKVVIAVHDRPLFDYLTLELSPAFPGDKLVTVELSRSATKASTAETRVWTFQKDESIAA